MKKRFISKGQDVLVSVLRRLDLSMQRIYPSHKHGNSYNNAVSMYDPDIKSVFHVSHLRISVDE